MKVLGFPSASTFATLVLAAGEAERSARLKTVVLNGARALRRVWDRLRRQNTRLELAGLGQTTSPMASQLSREPRYAIEKRKGDAMQEVFAEPIRKLPEADIPLKGVIAYLSQSDNHQILFMRFEEDVDLPEHSHAAQVGIVLEGRIDLVIDGKEHSFTKGDRYYIPDGVRHSCKIYKKYADITFFDDPKRYSPKK